MGSRRPTTTGMRWAALAAPLLLALACSKSSDSDKGPGVVQSLRINPSVALLRDAASTLQLQVLGVTSTGKTVDLTASTEGTLYSSTNPPVAAVTPEGLVAAVGRGTAAIAITNGAFSTILPVYSDFSPALTEGDFDLVVLAQPVRKGAIVAIPLVLDGGTKRLGSYRVVVTFNPAQYEVVSVGAGSDLGVPLAVNRDDPGRVVIADGFDPALGASPTGTQEAARILLRVTGDPGQASIITGEVLGISNDQFPAAPIGPSTPRPFLTGSRWLAIE